MEIHADVIEHNARQRGAKEVGCDVSSAGGVRASLEDDRSIERETRG